MKKFLSLFLALALCLGVFAGVSLAVEKPLECAPEKAGVVVTHAGDSTAKYYFDTLSQNVINWACAELAGDTTITLTKNLDLSPSASVNYFSVPYEKGGWYESKPDDKSLTIDLGGKTIHCESDSYLFKMSRYGMNVKNGTIDYFGSRSIFGIGNSTENTATTTGTKYKPYISLENVHIYNNSTGSTSHVLFNNVWDTTVTVKDSVLWSAKLSTLNISKTDQTKLSGFSKHEGPAKITVNVTNSTIISGDKYPITIGSKVDLAKDVVSVNLKDTTLVSTTGAAYAAIDAASFHMNGQTVTEKADWSLFLRNGQTATGTAYVVGTAAAAEKLPFTDVAENAWYYAFVRDLYATGIINGMTETTFAPEGTLTYGQALKLITLAIGNAEQAPTDTHWASGYLNNALGKGWLYSEVNLDGKITRLQFCQLAAAAAGIVDQPAANPFTDTDDGAVLALYHAGIINGMTETTFSPNASLTRAQISKIICGILAK